MIPAIIIGRGGSKGFPNKNSTKVLGLELMRYPIRAAKQSKYVTDVFFSTEDPYLTCIAKSEGVNVIDRPKELATNEALGEDVFIHACKYINSKASTPIRYLVLMFANAPCITGKMIDEMIVEFFEGELCDSICTVSKYNMFAINRSRILYNGFLIKSVNLSGSTCDRNSIGDQYFYDCSCAVVSARTMNNIKDMPPPQPWLGRSIKPYFQIIPALDVDYEWQLGQIEYWLKNEKTRS